MTTARGVARPARLLALLVAALLGGCRTPADRVRSAEAGSRDGADAVFRRPDDAAAVADVLASIRAIDTGLLSVSEEDGRFLRVLAASSGAARGLEIGAAYGYSAIWIGLGLRETGGHLTAIEYDHARAADAAANVERAGLADIVTIVDGDAFVEIPKLPGTFDLVFLDAWKPDYQRFLELTEPRLEPGGLFLAHNVVNKADEMGDFLAAVHRNPRLLTSIVRPSGEGMMVAYKLRN